MKHLYTCINDYAECGSKISYILFLHDYLLACEISTIRTFALNFIIFTHSLFLWTFCSHCFLVSWETSSWWPLTPSLVAFPRLSLFHHLEIPHHLHTPTFQSHYWLLRYAWAVYASYLSSVEFYLDCLAQSHPAVSMAIYLT